MSESFRRTRSCTFLEQITTINREVDHTRFTVQHTRLPARSLKYNTRHVVPGCLSVSLSREFCLSSIGSLAPADFHVRLFADREGKQPWRVSPVIARTQIGFIHGQLPYTVACSLCSRVPTMYIPCKFLSTTFKSLPRALTPRETRQVQRAYVYTESPSLYREQPECSKYVSSALSPRVKLPLEFTHFSIHIYISLTLMEHRSNDIKRKCGVRTSSIAIGRRD